MLMKIKPFDILRVIISFSLIGLLVYIMRNSMQGLAGCFALLAPPAVALALALIILPLFILAARLRLILAAQGINISLGDTVTLIFIGYFFNALLPTAVGGDAVKAYYIAKKSGDVMRSFAAVFIDRLLGMLAMMCLGIIALLAVKSELLSSRLMAVLLAVLIAGIAILILLLNKGLTRRFTFLVPLLNAIKIKDKMRNMYDALSAFRSHKRLLFAGYLISFVSQIIGFSAVYVLTGALGTQVPLTYVYFAMSIIAVISMLPSIGGLGVREGGFVLLFSPVIGKEAAFTLGILWLGLLFIIAFIGGLLYALSDRYKVKLKEVPA